MSGDGFESGDVGDARLAAGAWYHLGVSDPTVPVAGEPEPSHRFSAVAPLVIALIAGIAGGVGTFTFGYGKGFSYLVNDPRSCVNCHVMQGHYDAWQNSSHARVATCNSCHLPHDPIGKWVTKADNGFFHSLAFTLDDFPDPIRIKPRNSRVTQGTCLSCHADIVHQMLPEDPDGEVPSCVSCHGDVGHALRGSGSTKRSAP